MQKRQSKHCNTQMTPDHHEETGHHISDTETTQNTGRNHDTEDDKSHLTACRTDFIHSRPINILRCPIRKKSKQTSDKCIKHIKTTDKILLMMNTLAEESGKYRLFVFHTI